MDLSFRPIIPASANNNNGTTPVTIGQPTFPPPNGKIVSAEMIRYFQDIIVYEFPTINKSYLKDCAVVAAFLQSTRVFDFLFFGTGDKLLYDGYFDTLIECLEKGLPVKNIMSRTFCRLMSKYGFNPNFHTITFTGDALGSFAEVLKSKFIFKDMVGKQHGQYTHTLQWFGVCLLSDEPGLIEGNYKFTNCIADLYAYMISPVSTSKFPGEATLDKTTNQVLEKTPVHKTLWDLCVDCFRDIYHRENPQINLYTSSYRSPANVASAMESPGALCNTKMAHFMARRFKKYAEKFKKFEGTNDFQKMAKALQTGKKRLHYNAGSGWITNPKQGTTVFVWTESDDKELQQLLEKAINGDQE